MKKIFTLLVATSFVVTIFGQTIFQSNLSSWSGGNPTDWMGSKTSIAAANVVEVPAGATYGTSMAALINTGTSHKRFTTQNIAVTAGATYEIKFWVSGAVGDIRTSYYNVTTGSYGTYNSYITATPTQTMVTQTVTLAASCDSAQFIISLRNTDATGIFLDSVAVSVSTPPVSTPYTINQIQYSPTTPFDSPHNAELVDTKGVVTGVQYNGYYLQDGNGAWNGIFVLDYTNVPTRGDSVFITGLVDEYFNLTEIKNVTVYNAVAGGTLPTPTTLTTMGVNDEQYEGVLVNVTNAPCTLDTTSNANREWTINDGSGALIADDKMFIYAPTVSTAYNVTGVVDYSFGNFKLLPRDINDISVASGINELSTTKISVYPNPAKNMLHININVSSFNVKILDVTGKTVSSVYSQNSTLTISTSNLNNGIYFYSITNDNGQIIANNRFIVTK